MVKFVKESGSPIELPPEVTFDPLIVGTRLRDIRETAGLDQTKWGEVIGRSSQAVSNWEVGRAMPGMPDLVQYAIRLGADLHWVLTGQQFTPTEPQIVQSVVRVTVAKKDLQED